MRWRQTARRLSSGGRIDRSRPVSVQFDGRSFAAYPGDTLASALLAGDQILLARSFKYHRPRGLMAAGVEEPNALVHLRDGNRHAPNAQATMVEVFDGLTSTSQNAWPSLQFDVGAVNGLMSRFFGAGFYYKTFIGPIKGTGFWMFWEGSTTWRS
ncbi:2Fe-2S iron-sulfur cluster-binding protein [Neorhizobium huautlense]|uniref:2Fe-2S iron-sulfur cluster-binding protein n=1 Tax=Neorhizobium huautlense TaxID=67774 RepID=UPI000CFA7472